MNMTATDRILTLDIVRGVAVLGILAMNIISFGLPMSAYVNPPTAGIEGSADWVSWAISFVLIDGKMRGLFSFLFGASMLLVIDRAVASGRSGAGVHYSRMFWLLVIGLLHFYLIWYGDILAVYAAIGMIAYLFRASSPTKLMGWAIGLITFQLLISLLVAASFYMTAGQVAGPNPDPQAMALWREMTTGFGTDPAEIAREHRIHRGGYADLLAHRTGEVAGWPLFMLFSYGAETLGYFLLGMWAFRTGFLTGQWSNASYRRTALICLAIALPAYAALAWWQVRTDFDLVVIQAGSMAGTIPFRPVMVFAFAALIILATRGGGALVDRLAATGRMAFTNYLATSLVMTTLFYGYGLGLYGHLSRTELWLPVVVMWGAMLAWSKPWLERYQYGPFEWLWRSLARRRLEPLRKAPAGQPALA